MTVIESLKVEYDRARSEVDRKAKHLAIACPPKTCRYCGRFWLQWKGSKLDGHAKCSVTATFRYLVRRTLSMDPTITYEKVGARLGVSPSIVRAWSFPIRSGR